MKSIKNTQNRVDHNDFTYIMYQGWRDFFYYEELVVIPVLFDLEKTKIILSHGFLTILFIKLHNSKISMNQFYFNEFK